MSDMTSSAPVSSPAPEAPAAPAAPTPAPRLRLWPAVTIIALLWAVTTLPALLLSAVPDAIFVVIMASSFAPLVATAALVVWWLFFSRIPWSQRWLGLAVGAGAGAGAWALAHPTMVSFVLMVFVLPLVATAWVAWLALTLYLRWPVRLAGFLAVLVLSWVAWDFVRFEGVNGTFAAEFRPRWAPTAEEKLQAALDRGDLKGNAPAAGAPLELRPGDWPGFRGADRDGRRTGTRIAADWKQHQPRQLWRHPVGPGWGSFAVIGDRAFTQEQRGADEVVVCYDAATGAEVWVQRDAARFSEPIAGPGPRATPTFHEGKLYVQGATGRLHCLDAATGEVRWTRDIVADANEGVTDPKAVKAKVPEWGFAGSPLVLQGVVTVFAGGPEGKCVLGYDAATGKPAWSAGKGQLSYCSPHPARLGGVEQVLIVTDQGLTAFHPTRGGVLWHHDWALEGMARVVQPTLVSETDVLVGTGFGSGTRRVHVAHEGEGWDGTKVVWTSKAISPYYNDMVVHRGHAYGFDNNFLTCVNLDDGKRKWKERGYGNGQVLLLADQDLLLVVSETGEVALVEASPEARKERGRFQAINGKTWNHPVVAHGKLFVRNGEEAACFDLADDGAKVADGR